MARSSRTAKVIFFWYRFGIGWGIGGHGLRSYKKTLARTPTVCTVAKVCRQCFGSGSLAHMSGGQNLLSLVNAKVGLGRPLSVLQVFDVYIQHNYL